MSRQERIVANVDPDLCARLQDSAALLTRAEGKLRKLPEVARNALAFYANAIASCVTCRAGIVCALHGTLSLRPEVANQKQTDVDPDDFNRAKHVYFRAFSAARGEQPAFGAAEGAALKRLIVAIGIDKACSMITKVYNDSFWATSSSIKTIAGDPSRHLGDTQVSGSRTSLQPDSGFRGGKEHGQ